MMMPLTEEIHYRLYCNILSNNLTNHKDNTNNCWELGEHLNETIKCMRKHKSRLTSKKKETIFLKMRCTSSQQNEM